MKTIKDINKLAKPHGIELIKGEGYFYWWPLADQPDCHPITKLRDTSVPVCHFTHQSFNGWLSDLEVIVKKIEEIKDLEIW